jgi:CTD small phosphatase-like protein 2
MLLVDNAAYSYLYQLENGIPIVPFYEDKDDEELLHLVRYVHEITALQEKTQMTLRDLNHRYFQLTAYMGCENIEMLGNLYKENMAKHREMIL